MEEMLKELMKAIGNVNPEDLLHDFRPFLVVYKDGRVQKFLGNLTVPPSIDAVTGVESKDVVVSTQTGSYVRLYKPQGLKSDEKVPVLVYIHGGGFVVETAASPVYHNHLNVLCSKANVIVVSVDYRTSPEHPLPAAYDDSWAALQWVNSGLAGAEPWLSTHVDPARIFLAGDSAGGNIAHNMAKRLAKTDPNPNPNTPEGLGLGQGQGQIALKGLVLIHPFFWGKDRIGSELQKMEPTTGLTSGATADRLWKFVHPTTTGSDDPLINPGMDPELRELVGEKVLVFVAEQDALRDRGVHYKEVLVKSGWKGDVQVVETHGENHVFHLINPISDKATHLLDQFSAFINSS